MSRESRVKNQSIVVVLLLHLLALPGVRAQRDDPKSGPPAGTKGRKKGVEKRGSLTVKKVESKDLGVRRASPHVSTIRLKASHVVGPDPKVVARLRAAWLARRSAEAAGRHDPEEEKRKLLDPQRFRVRLEVAERKVTVSGSGQFPDGTLVRLDLFFAREPVGTAQWARFASGGFRHAWKGVRARLAPGSYEVEGLFEKILQPRPLQRQLSGFPERILARDSARLGDPVAILQGKLEGLLFYARSLAGVAREIEAMKAAFDDAVVGKRFAGDGVLSVRDWRAEVYARRMALFSLHQAAAEQEAASLSYAFAPLRRRLQLVLGEAWLIPWAHSRDLWQKYRPGHFPPLPAPAGSHLAFMDRPVFAGTGEFVRTVEGEVSRMERSLGLGRAALETKLLEFAGAFLKAALSRLEKGQARLSGERALRLDDWSRLVSGWRRDLGGRSRAFVALRNRIAALFAPSRQKGLQAERLDLPGLIERDLELLVRHRTRMLLVKFEKPVPAALRRLSGTAAGLAARCRERIASLWR